jgi:uncharacterized membrane protein
LSETSIHSSAARVTARRQNGGNMNAWVGKFPEIAQLSKDEQRQLLEQARYTAFVTLGLSGKAALYMVVYIVLAAAIAIIPPLLFGITNIVARGIFVMAGILCAGLFFQKLYCNLLAQGLKEVLAKAASPHIFD